MVFDDERGDDPYRRLWFDDEARLDPRRAGLDPPEKLPEDIQKRILEVYQEDRSRPPQDIGRAMKRRYGLNVTAQQVEAVIQQAL
ncbi:MULTISPECIES: hypothetical protein [Micromonospora]|uniref:Uncharacterized protein n=1 Tax=Micromonospora tulbaghiae TaxID=479978 RepID=A0AAW4JJZ9_9ACTN|nr:hypothetical protein [Micromonospora tulbaghiae]MBO4139111.1 hypothetical protein [Micromonospora tulbaghiae]